MKLSDLDKVNDLQYRLEIIRKPTNVRIYSKEVDNNLLILQGDTEWDWFLNSLKLLEEQTLRELKKLGVELEEE